MLAAVHEDQGIAPQAGRLRFTHVSLECGYYSALRRKSTAAPAYAPAPAPASASFLSWLLCTVIGVVDIATAAAAAAVGIAFNADDEYTEPTAPRGAFQSGVLTGPRALWLQPPRERRRGRREASNLNNAPIITGGSPSAVRAWYRPEPATDENETRRRSYPGARLRRSTAAAALVTTRVK